MSEELKKIFKNYDALKWIIVGLIGFIVIILVFGAGVKVGTLKARYSYKWAESYHKNFAGPRKGFLKDWRSFPRGDLIEGHGAFGEIIEFSSVHTVAATSSNSGQTLSFILRGRSDVEKIIVINEDTILKKRRGTIEKNELKVGDRVTIIGSPNEEGQIEAKLIRVFSGDETQTPRKHSRFLFFR